MAINYATKFAPKVDKLVEIDSYTEKNLNKNWDFTGVRTVKIYTLSTVGLHKYKRSGDARYGVGEDLQDTVQEMKVAQDLAFTFTIDAGDDSETMNVRDAGVALKNQTSQVVIPWLDKFRFAIMCEEVQDGYTDSTTLSKTNVYEKFLDGTAKLNEKGFSTGLVAYMKPKAYNLLKQDSSFVKAGDMSQKMLLKGQVGECDGVAIINVAGARLPEGIDFILIQNQAMVSPMKLKSFRIIDNPENVDGKKVNGRMLFDAFILASRKYALYVQGARKTAIAFTEAESYVSKASGIDVYCDEKVYTKVASSAITLPDIGDAFDATGWTKVTNDDGSDYNGEALDVTITGSSTNVDGAIVIVDRNGNVRDTNAVELD